MLANWIQIKGTYVTIDGSTITYKPPIAGDNATLREEGDSKEMDALSRIKSSQLFENGSIEFSFKIYESDALITVALGTLFIGINSKYSQSLYSIRKGGQQLKVIAQSGTKGSLSLDTWHKFKVEVIGSNLSFLIDDVVILKGVQALEYSQVAMGLKSSKEIFIKDFYVKSKKPKAFIVMQFTAEYNELYRDVIKPVCEFYGYDCIRADEFYQSNLILNDIIGSIKESSIIIADITPDNPNVFYEVGYAHALGKPTILLSDKKREKLPFDVSGFRTLFYDNTIGGKSKVEENLKKHLEFLSK